ncbi:MAG: dihydrodipicolinate synthase family protein [Candidatus Baltobacteraceae bacterium]
MTQGFSGVIAATLTPVNAQLQPDLAKAHTYYEGLLAAGCDGLNVLGTTGEAMSFSVEQRAHLMRGLAKHGLPLERAMVGTGSSSLADTVALTNTAIDAGFAGVLVMPPFFYRDASQDGILEFFEALAKMTKIEPGKLYLYNFPQMSGTTFTLELVRRIRDILPVAGLKDSSNDLRYAEALHLAFPELRLFPSSESHLRFAKNMGFAGCISGTVALWPKAASDLWVHAEDASSEPQQIQITSRRDLVAAYPLIPAVRFLTAFEEKDESWERPLPPLQQLDAQAQAALCDRYLLSK